MLVSQCELSCSALLLACWPACGTKALTSVRFQPSKASQNKHRRSSFGQELDKIRSREVGQYRLADKVALSVSLLDQAALHVCCCPGSDEEIRVFKLGKNRWSYNSIRLSFTTFDEAHILGVQEAVDQDTQDAGLKSWHQESGVVYNLRMDNGSLARLHAFVVHGDPRKVYTVESSQQLGNYQQEHFEWTPVTRKDCMKGCTGTACSPPLRVLANNDVPGGAPHINDVLATPTSRHRLASSDEESDRSDMLADSGQGHKSATALLMEHVVRSSKHDAHQMGHATESPLQDRNPGRGQKHPRFAAPGPEDPLPNSQYAMEPQLQDQNPCRGQKRPRFAAHGLEDPPPISQCALESPLQDRNSGRGQKRPRFVAHGLDDPPPLILSQAPLMRAQPGQAGSPSSDDSNSAWDI
ncbi:hypothetical protein WJX74_005663 [Apatococcus lobatus]|uniref:Uncharacterized protein n=1 Tax=Apatococcus lobatus TaxID=904363 RepID=A0AAW1SA85_9CHLO